MASPLVTLIILAVAIALLVFIVKKVAKFVIVASIILIILIIVGSLANLDFRSFVMDKTTQIVGMVVGNVEDRAVGYAREKIKEDINITKIKEGIIGEIK